MPLTLLSFLSTSTQHTHTHAIPFYTLSCQLRARDQRWYVILPLLLNFHVLLFSLFELVPAKLDIAKITTNVILLWQSCFFFVCVEILKFVFIFQKKKKNSFELCRPRRIVLNWGRTRGNITCYFSSDFLLIC